MHGARRQSDEAIGRAADDPLVKGRMTHEADDQEIDLALLNQANDGFYNMARHQVHFDPHARRRGVSAPTAPIVRVEAK